MPLYFVLLWYFAWWVVNKFADIHWLHNYSINPCHVELLGKTWKHVCISHHSLTLKCLRLLKLICKENKNICIALSQYHCCWWPGDVRSLGINSHDIDVFWMWYSGFSTREVIYEYEWKQLPFSCRQRKYLTNCACWLMMGPHSSPGNERSR